MTGKGSPVGTDLSADDDGGWTRVPVRRHPRGRAGRAQPSVTFKGRKPGDQGKDSLMTASEIADEYHRIRNQWETTDASQSLRRLITGIVTPSASPISRAICLGIGTFDPPDGGWDTKRRTFIQLIAFLLMVETLEAKLGTKIECIFQEPIFREPDKSFIASLGHLVVESPRGFEMVSPDVLLYGVHLYRPVYVDALDRCLPVIFVGTDLEVWDSVSLEGPDDLVNGRIMEATYGKAKCPQDSSSTAFSGTCIYWRLENDDRRNVLSSPQTDHAMAKGPVVKSSEDTPDAASLAKTLASVSLK